MRRVVKHNVKQQKILIVTFAIVVLATIAAVALSYWKAAEAPPAAPSENSGAAGIIIEQIQ